MNMAWLQRARQDGAKYLNPVETTIGDLRLMAKVLPLYLNNKAETEPKTPPGPFRTEHTVFDKASASGLRITWFGHSSVLIEIDGFRILTDPVWDERASPFSFMGPRRFFEPTLPLEQMPELDVVLLSHDHYDHLGEQTIRRLSRLNAAARARWVTSAGVGRWLRKFGVRAERIQELDWTQSVRIEGDALGSALEITDVPSRHFSGRWPWDRMHTLWSSFVLAGVRHRVYFGADSGPWPGFAEIAEQFGPFDLTMLEIGAYHPLWGSIHLGPDGAAEMYRQMGGPERAGVLFPIHWGLFNLALHAWREPIERLTEIADGEGWPLFAPVPGEPTEVERGQGSRSSWWRAVPAASPQERTSAPGLPLDQQPL